MFRYNVQSDMSAPAVHGDGVECRLRTTRASPPGGEASSDEERVAHRPEGTAIEVRRA